MFSFFNESLLSSAILLLIPACFTLYLSICLSILLPSYHCTRLCICLTAKVCVILSNTLKCLSCLHRFENYFNEEFVPVMFHFFCPSIYVFFLSQLFISLFFLFFFTVIFIIIVLFLSSSFYLFNFYLLCLLIYFFTNFPTVESPPRCQR